MPVEFVCNLVLLQAKFKSADVNHLFVVDFFADWCGPCRFIAPHFEEFSGRFENATFLKVDVDYSPDISQHYGVRAMPTFVLIKKGKEMERIQGANPQALEQAIKRHYSNSPITASDDEKFFLQKFVLQAEKAKLYTDIVYKTLALSLIPDEKLREESTDSDGALSIFQLARALLNWFKNEFFSWCDSPICDFCGNQTPINSGLYGTPTSEELEHRAHEVEVYLCSCGREVRFPRYNDPAKLLETRKGRCGEWANCFALIASAMDFDVRLIYDVTDHVWVELWIPECDSWIHCDPCENAIDRPLLYEKGWNKKLSYVIAFGSDHVCDVTWRYTVNHKETLRVRRTVREGVLSNFLMKLNTRMAVDITPERALELRRRRVRELVNFLVIGERSTNGEIYGGRISGNLQWRKDRSELGCDAKKDVVLSLNEDELTKRKFSLEYNCAKDFYMRGSEKIAGWSTYANTNGFVQRKQEMDWRMAYLCLHEGESDAEISWSINLCDVMVKSVKLQIFGATAFENGSVLVTVCAGDVCYPFKEGANELLLEDVPSSILKIKAHLSGGTGINAFQHAQLFRTPLDNQELQMKIEIDFV